MDKENMQHQLHDVICTGRYCSTCFMKKYKRENNIPRCVNIPVQVQLKYARELFLRRDKYIMNSMRFWDSDGNNTDAIKLIRSGGVQYDS